MKYLIVSKTNNVTMCNFGFGKKKSQNNRHVKLISNINRYLGNSSLRAKMPL